MCFTRIERVGVWHIENVDAWRDDLLEMERRYSTWIGDLYTRSRLTGGVSLIYGTR